MTYLVIVYSNIWKNECFDRRFNNWMFPILTSISFFFNKKGIMRLCDGVLDFKNSFELKMFSIDFSLNSHKNKSLKCVFQQNRKYRFSFKIS